jgi:peptide/nickel transport system permease protein
MAVAEPYARAPVAARPRILQGGRTLDWAAAGLLALVTLIALLAPVLSPHDPVQPVNQPQLPPGTAGALLGTDGIGRDVLSRVLIGWRASWFAALGVIASGLLVGGLIGLAAGTAGGVLDAVLMRITDAFLALPAPVLAIAVVAALGPSFLHTLLASGGPSTHASSVGRYERWRRDPTWRRHGWRGPDESGSPSATSCRARSRRP